MKLMRMMLQLLQIRLALHLSSQPVQLQIYFVNYLELQNSECPHEDKSIGPFETVSLWIQIN